MKSLILPKQKQPVVFATNHYNHLFVAVRNFRSKKEFVYQAGYQVHPTVQVVQSWDESWFGNYE